MGGFGSKAKYGVENASRSRCLSGPVGCVDGVGYMSMCRFGLFTARDPAKRPRSPGTHSALLASGLRLRLVTSRGPPYPSRSPRADS